jgi:hypothetical protein
VVQAPSITANLEVRLFYANEEEARRFHALASAVASTLRGLVAATSPHTLKAVNGMLSISTPPLLWLEESRSSRFAFVFVLFLTFAPVAHPAHGITPLAAGFLVFAEG